MKLHARHGPTTRSSLAIQQTVLEQVSAESLAYAELVSILTGILASWTKFQIRDERADAETPQASLEPEHQYAKCACGAGCAGGCDFRCEEKL